MPLPDELTFSISIPSDDEGFYGRECPNETCGRYFKIYSDGLGSEMHCPYCGEAFLSEDMLTSEQARYAREAAVNEVMPLIQREFQDMLRRATSGSRVLRYVPGPLAPRPAPRPPDEKGVDSELECPDCHTRFQVDGIFGYCPGCRSEILRLYDANLALIKREITAGKGATRALRHAYSDLVATFETFCRKEAERLGVEEEGRFQNLDHTRKLFKRCADVDIFGGLSQGEVRSLKRVFEKRHVHEHNEGIISARYVKMIPEDKALLGQRAELSVVELETTAGLLRRTLETLVSARGKSERGDGTDV